MCATDCSLSSPSTCKLLLESERDDSWTALLGVGVWTMHLFCVRVCVWWWWWWWW